MRVAMIGTGYVGLVSGACFSDFGHDVVCVDKDAAKIAALRGGEIPIFEPGLEALVAANMAAGRLRFSTDLAAAVKGAEAVFIAVGTPSRRGDGHADLSYVFAAAEEIADALDGYALVVTKSTVPVGTNRAIRERMRRHRAEAAFDIVSNPEFLREGSAIEDFKRPDRVIVGTEIDQARQIMRQLYKPLFINETPMLFASLETAEMIKYAANAFLATKVTFINEIADLCEKVGANVQQVAKGMGLDGRIGAKFLHPGPGYGGSCFPKDTRAIAHTAAEEGAPLRIVETVIAVNDRRKKAMAERVIAACGGALGGKTIAVLGVAFKPNTDDMREAPALDILPALQTAGADIRAHDPKAMDEAAKLLPGITWCAQVYDTMDGADAVVILTEWNAYRALDFSRMKALLKSPVLVDLRNIYSASEMRAEGFDYSGVGIGEI